MTGFRAPALSAIVLCALSGLACANGGTTAGNQDAAVDRTGGDTAVGPPPADAGQHDAAAHDAPAGDAGPQDANAGDASPPPTTCAANAGDVVINEINFAPRASAPKPAIRYEYVELYNAGAGPVTLDGWQIVNKGKKLFAQLPSGAGALVMPPGAFLLVVSASALTDSTIVADHDLSDGRGVFVAPQSATFTNGGDAVGLYCSSLYLPGTIVDFVSYAEHGGFYDATRGYGELDPTIDDNAVAAGMWVDGYAVDTLSSGTTGRTLALAVDGAKPNRTTEPGLDFFQYPERCPNAVLWLGTPGDSNSTGCPSEDGGVGDGGTPPTTCDPTARAVVINEVNYAVKTTAAKHELRYEYVELYNSGAAAVSLDGWRIVNRNLDLFALLPSGVDAITLPPGAFLAVFAAPAVAELANDLDLSDLSGRFVATATPVAFANAGDSVQVYCSSLFAPETLVDYMAYAQNGGVYDAVLGTGEADPAVDDYAVAAGLWLDGYAVDTVGSSTTGRALALVVDGQRPSHTLTDAGVLAAPGSDWMQYPDVCPDLSAVLGGTPGAANGSGCPPVDGGTPAQDSGVVDAGTD